MIEGDQVRIVLSVLLPDGSSLFPPHRDSTLSVTVLPLCLLLMKLTSVVLHWSPHPLPRLRPNVLCPSVPQQRDFLPASACAQRSLKGMLDPSYRTSRAQVTLEETQPGLGHLPVKLKGGCWEGEKNTNPFHLRSVSERCGNSTADRAFHLSRILVCNLQIPSIKREILVSAS